MTPAARTKAPPTQTGTKRKTAARPKLAAKIRAIETAEGVPIRVELADRGDRFGAVMIDIIFLFLGMLLTLIGFYFLLGTLDLTGSAAVVSILIFFFFRNFYFMFFELKWHGRTPGKKKMGIRVIDRFGKPLSTEAIFARNMMREVEIFIPMAIVFAGTGAGVDGLLQLFAFIWAMILAGLPLFNKDNLRAGDLIAGTLVIKEPKIALLDDIIASTAVNEEGADARYSFSAKQLSVYGVYELQTLEHLIREDTAFTKDKKLAAGRAIAKKIGWTDPIEPARMNRFLTAYYNALRKHLESDLLMGKRKEDKYDAGDPPAP